MHIRVSLLLFLAWFLGGRFALAQVSEPLGSAFSYQGQLLENGAPASGHYDLRFGLFTTESGGSLVTPSLTQTNVLVSDGLFISRLDFGQDVFTGSACWMEISVRAAGIPAEFTTLRPRQLLAPTPFAIYTLRAESLIGSLPESQLPPNVARLDTDQTFTGAATFGGPVVIGAPGSDVALDVQGSVRASAFTGDGAGLSNVVAHTLSASMIQRFWRVLIPFVTVTNAGNEADYTGKGAVSYDFRIGKYEVNNNQYAAFLNAVGAEDPHELYDTNMAARVHGGIERSGSPGEYAYSVKPGLGHRPVAWADFHDALRFCNWLHNGQPSGPQDDSTTEDGAYTLRSETIAANTVTRNAHARFWLPSDDEWYKAAYHQPLEADGDLSDYWRFPTRSNDAPFSEPPPGGINSVNVCCETERMATDVGAYIHSPSFYGTFDQGGNVQEWTEEIIFVTNRRLRGGSWSYNEFYAESDDFEFDTPDYPADGIGFRVAGAFVP